ncbi:MAG: endonuclease [Bacteroidales bacterium]|nr:endonuclease [Bacteroidales bacterium]
MLLNRNLSFKRFRAGFLHIGLFLLVSVASGQIPSGYYNTAAGKTGETLQIALYNIIKGHMVISYTPGVWNAFYKTDPKPNGKVWDMYSDVPGGTPPYEYTFGTNQCGVGGGGVEGDCYSREHSFPGSWFNNLSPMYTDLFHIFPADQYINNMHSNYPYAAVGTVTAISLNGSKKGSCATPGYSGIVFEPINAYKGDFARAYLYMATRYENIIATWYANSAYADAVLDGTSYPVFETWYLNLLISWHNQDPVSAKEIARNDSIYKIQLNRNPFIDHPEYVNAIWMPSGPKPEPSSHVTNFSATNGSPAYSAIQLSWNDATGTVIPDGYLIRGSSTGFSAIVAPVDGTPVATGGLDKNVGSGVQSGIFSGLSSNTTYYFKIFPYTNAGSTIDYKTGEPVPSASSATTTGTSILQPGDIAIIEYQSVNPDKLSFITFTQLNASTEINFTDNGFKHPDTVRTGEGFLKYTAQTVIPSGTVISWYNGMNIAGTGWNSTSPSNFAFNEAGDQLFAYQGVWGSNQSLICGLNAGNSGWITSGGALSTTSYFPTGLTDGVNSLTFTEKNGNYNLITAGSVNALKSLVVNTPNWTRNIGVIGTPVWSFIISNSTNINQNATVLHFLIGSEEVVTVDPAVVFTILGNITLN